MVSPPPTTENAPHPATALREPEGARRERRLLEHAHRAVPHDRARALERGRELGDGGRPDVEAHRDPAGISRIATVRMPSVSSSAGGDDRVDGQPDRHAARSAPARARARAASIRSRLERATRPTPWPSAREEREGHPAADQEPVDLDEEVLDERELVGDLGPAEDRDERPLRRLEDPAERRRAPGS